MFKFLTGKKAKKAKTNKAEKEINLFFKMQEEKLEEMKKKAIQHVKQVEKDKKHDKLIDADDFNDDLPSVFDAKQEDELKKLERENFAYLAKQDAKIAKLSENKSASHFSKEQDAELSALMAEMGMGAGKKKSKSKKRRKSKKRKSKKRKSKRSKKSKKRKNKKKR